MWMVVRNAGPGLGNTTVALRSVYKSMQGCKQAEGWKIPFHTYGRALGRHLKSFDAKTVCFSKLFYELISHMMVNAIDTKTVFSQTWWMPGIPLGWSSPTTRVTQQCVQQACPWIKKPVHDSEATCHPWLNHWLSWGVQSSLHFPVFRDCRTRAWPGCA